MGAIKTKITPSKHLNTGAKFFFQRMAPHLIADNRLRLDNLMFFEALCKELDIYFNIDVPDHKMIVDGQNGSKVINPLIRERRNILTTAISLGKEFGLTPKGLHALGMFGPSEEKSEDPVAKMMMAKTVKMKAV